MKKKTIIIVTQNFANGGTERRATELANSFVERGYDVTYLAVNKIYSDCVLSLDKRIPLISFSELSNYTSDLPKRKKVEKHSGWKIKTNRFFHKLCKKVGITSSCFKKRYDRLIASVPLRTLLLDKRHAVIIVFGLSLVDSKIFYSARTTRSKLIVSETSAPQIRAASRLSHDIKKADAYVFQTYEQKRFFDNYTCRRKYVIYNPLVSALPPCFTGTRKKIIVNFCRINREKNLLLLINAFKKLSLDHPDYELRIYGAASTESAREYKKAVESLIENLELSEKAALFSPDPDIQNLVFDFAMFVSSSDHEGLSNSMLEAMAMGMPCVCTDCLGGGAREMIRDGENGLLVPAGDVNALYLAMKRMIEEPGLAEKCGKNAAQIRKELSIERIAGQWIDVIESI